MWPKNWSFCYNISYPNEYPGLISFKMDWLDLLAIQGTLKGLLQQHSSKALILQHLPFFTFQLSHPYMTTGKTTVMTRWAFVSKVMSLLFNMLSRLIMGFPGGWEGKASACNARCPSSFLGLERSPGEGNATLSSILALRIPWKEEPRRLQSMGSQRVGHDWWFQFHFQGGHNFQSKE